MSDVGNFNINVNGVSYMAETVMNFELYGYNYCIYGVKIDGNYNIYCGEIVNNTVVPVRENDEKLIDKIVLSLTSTLKR